MNPYDEKSQTELFLLYEIMNATKGNRIFGAITTTEFDDLLDDIPLGSKIFINKIRVAVNPESGLSVVFTNDNGNHVFTNRSESHNHQGEDPLTYLQSYVEICNIGYLQDGYSAFAWGGAAGSLIFYDITIS